VVSYLRRHQGDELLVVMNATPVPRDDYRVGAPNAGRYRELLCSDHSAFGGSGYTTRERVETEPHAYHGCAESLRLRLPPLACLVLGREP
jgi:1,4-alpha-glucan branching enzyme